MARGALQYIDSEDRLASERGAVVRGLRHLVTRLQQIGEDHVHGVLVDGADQFSLVFLDDALSTVEALLVVHPQPRPT